jgi:NitT/TauT family transport system substrate-binding protein
VHVKITEHHRATVASGEAFVDWLDEQWLVMDDAVSAMVSGKVAAGEFWEPFGGQVLKSLKGSKAVANSGEEEWLKTGLLGDGLYMSDAFLTKTPEIAKKAMKAYWDAVDWWRKNPAEGNAIIAKGIKFDVKDVEDVLGKDDKPFSGGIYCFDLRETDARSKRWYEKSKSDTCWTCR